MRALKSAALAVLILAGCSSDSDDASESESGATVVVGAPIAASATYTGEACPYDGPNEVTVGATLSITVVNRTTEPEIGFSLWQVPDGTTAEEIAEGGISEIVGPMTRPMTSSSLQRIRTQSTNSRPLSTSLGRGW